MNTPLHIRGKDFWMELINKQDRFGRCLKIGDIMKVKTFEYEVRLETSLPSYDDSKFIELWKRHFKTIKMMMPAHDAKGYENLMVELAEINAEVEGEGESDAEIELWNSVVMSLKN
jgi:hypothetical protein